MGTLVWTDDFESYTAGATITAPWVNTNSSWVVTAQAHGGTKSLAVGTSGGNTSCYRVTGSNLTQWYLDFWMWTNSVGSTVDTQWIGLNASTATSLGAVCVGVGPTGAGKVGRGDTGTSWFTFTVSTGAWHRYLFEVTTGVAGTAKLTVDGTVVGTYSGDTRDADLAAFASVVWTKGATIGPSPPAEFYVDDIAVYSGTSQSFTTWSTTDKSASLTLTGGNLIATAGAANQSVRGKDPKRVGKYYIEYTSTTTQNSVSRIGFAAAATQLATGTTASISVYASGTIVSYDIFGVALTNGQLGSAWTTGSVVCAALDLDNRMCWFRLGAAGNWNNAAANNPATGVGGLPVSAVSLGVGVDAYPFVYFAGSANSITANFGGSAFTGAVPAGFTSGWDDSVSIVTNVVASQVALEQWGSGTPDMQATIVLIEHWASVADAAPVTPSSDTRVMILA